MSEKLKVIKYTLLVFVRDGCPPCKMFKLAWGDTFNKLRSEFSEDLLTIRLMDLSEIRERNVITDATEVWPSIYLIMSDNLQKIIDEEMDLSHVAVLGSIKPLSERTQPTVRYSPENIKTWINSLIMSVQPRKQIPNSQLRCIK